MFRLEIETDKAAFQDDDLRAELSRMLRDVARRIEDGARDACYVKDINGNTVGTFRLEEEEK